MVGLMIYMNFFMLEYTLYVNCVKDLLVESDKNVS
jgi:hypothetical protein